MNGFSHESARSKSVEWYTPRYIFDAIGLEFDLDPCSPGKDIVPWIPAKKSLTVKDDGLLAKWKGNVWMNPPYDTRTPYWLERLSLHGTGIALLFVRADTKWFHQYVPIADAICLIRGRVRFVSSEHVREYVAGTYKPIGGPGAASMLVAYGKQNARAVFGCGLGLTLPIDNRKLLKVRNCPLQVGIIIKQKGGE